MIAIIDYGVGNLHSVLNAFKSLGFDASITSNKDEILKADKVVLPGVGAFSDAINTFKKRGFEEVLKHVINNGTHVLGICVGMQMLFEYDYEFGVHEGLGFLKGSIEKFSGFDNDVKLKVPQMGWNNLMIDDESGILKNIDDNAFVYFVHSYRLTLPAECVVARAKYGEEFGAVVEKDNIHATQFHPEKSGEVGLKILKNFGEL